MIQDNGTGISVQGVKINNVRFADDINTVEESVERLWESVHILGNAGLRINAENTKDHGIWNTGHKQPNSDGKLTN